ncbi:alpha/beta fold hydrolase [Tropicimonas marinistellae]|uniref:alpha/beta fold hydrolase n=1 Tax=Tropicimonas marinistellae TaxID=1739787 RepID=UPI000834F14E|nr:alpha/beta hydrolase [Tropicimonas marinistellae]
MIQIPGIDTETNTHFDTPSDPVVLLHGTAMDPATWTGLREHIGCRLPVSAPSLPGYGRDSRWRPDHPARLDSSAEELAQGILLPDRPVHLVGHDFGAVLAMKIASANPGHVASLTLIEPIAYNCLFPVHEDVWQIHREVSVTVERMNDLLAAGDAGGAMARYTDLVNGEGTWLRTSERHRLTLALQARQALSDLRAIEADRMSPGDLAGIVCPTLMIRGNRTSWMLEQVALELRQSIPFLRDEVIDGAAHFPQLTYPHIVDPMIVEFLVRVGRQWQDNNVTLRNAA